MLGTEYNGTHSTDDIGHFEYFHAVLLEFSSLTAEYPDRDILIAERIRKIERDRRAVMTEGYHLSLGRAPEALPEGYITDSLKKVRLALRVVTDEKVHTG